MRIRSLDHLVLTVSNPEATIAFYERLGMLREEFGDGRLALRFGRQKLNLHQAGRPIQPHARRPTPGSADICLLVEGTLDAVEHELERAGVVFELGPVERTGATGRLRSLYVRDPDGNLVELSERI
jgi:catechol 2,3-dioxygenase-like lactoylglutathione lyase family enzyme